MYALHLSPSDYSKNEIHRNHLWPIRKSVDSLSELKHKNTGTKRGKMLTSKVTWLVGKNTGHPDWLIGTLHENIRKIKANM